MEIFNRIIGIGIDQKDIMNYSGHCKYLNVFETDDSDKAILEQMRQQYSFRLFRVNLNKEITEDAITLDSLNLIDPGLIHINSPVALEILQGAERTINLYRPKIVCNNKVRNLTKWFKDKNYKKVSNVWVPE